MNARLQILLDTLRKLLRRNAIRRVERVLQKARPEDVASILRSLDATQQLQVFELLPNDEVRAEMLSETDGHIFAAIATAQPLERIASLLDRLSADDQANMLSELDEELREKLIGQMKADADLAELLDHEEDTAGRIMSPDFFALSAEVSCAEAISELQRRQAELEMAFYIYVIDQHERLSGVVSLRALLIHPPETGLASIATTDTIYARVDQDQEEVAQLAARYNLLAIPVVDEGLRLVGIVTIDDVIDVIRDEATEDILKMAGADESAYESGSLWRNFLTRAPWLFATWLGGLAASLLIGAFEHQLEQKVALAAFIPIVLGMGGNVGTQTATIMVRGLATGQVSPGLGLRYLIRESSVGALLGIFYGVLLGVYAILRYFGDGVPLAATVGLSILTSMLSAAAVGACTPLIFHRLGVDPAVATGPLVTTTVDVLGILAYFLMAQALIL